MVHFIGARLGADAEVALAANFATGSLQPDPVAAEDWERIATLVHTYADARIGLTDASVVACAERRGATVIATTDRRDFSSIRPRHAAAFELVP